MRKSLALILSAVLITALTACGTTPSAPAESGKPASELSSETTVNTETTSSEAASTETTTVSENTTDTTAVAETTAYLGNWSGTGVTVGGGHNVNYTIDIKSDGTLSGRVILPMLDVGFKDFSRTYTTETLADGNIFIVSKAKEGDDLQDEIALIYLTRDGKMYWTLDSDSGSNKFTDKDGTTRSYPIDSSTPEFVKETAAEGATAAADSTTDVSVTPLTNSFTLPEWMATAEMVYSDPVVPGVPYAENNTPYKPVQGDVVTVTTAADVNFRSKPSTVEGEVYFIIHKGAVLEVIDSAPNVPWVKCTYNSETGYINKSYLSF